jgi:WD40 repeat protein
MKSLVMNIIITLSFALLLATGCTHTELKRSSAGSPQGNVPFGEKAFSPDGKMYAREVEPKAQGRIGIYDTATENRLKVLTVRQHPADQPNDLKGLAWSPDSKWLAVMYHYDGGGHISVVSVDTEEIKQIPIKKQFHHMEFSADGMKIKAESDVLDIR